MTTTDVDNWPADADGVQGPDLMARFQKHAERFETELVFDQIHTVDLDANADAPDRRQRRIHVRRADHRDRRLRALPRPAVGAGVHGQGRVGVRDLRRLLLQGPGRGRRRRRQHRRRGSALPVEHREARHRRASPRQVPRRGDPDRQADGEDRATAATSASSGITRSTKCSATRRGVTGVRVKHKTTGATQDLPVHGVFIAIGHTPNTQIFEGQLDMADGYIKVKSGTRRQRDGDQRSRRVRRRRRRRPRLPPGGHLGGHRLHGGARRRGVPRSARRRRSAMAKLRDLKTLFVDADARASPATPARDAPRAGDSRRAATRHPPSARSPPPSMPTATSISRRRSPTCKRLPPRQPRRSIARAAPAPIPRQRIADERDALLASKYGAEPAPQSLGHRAGARARADVRAPRPRHRRR